MEEIQSIINSIGLEEYMNSVLVTKGVRPAFMIQPPDYEEKTAEDKITKKKLQNIKKQFPDLFQQVTDHGIIISKKPININETSYNQDIGKILGYPCYRDFNSILTNKDKISITYGVFVNLKYIPGLTNYNRSIQLFADRCIDKSTYKIHEEIRNKIETILNSDKIIGGILDNVELNEEIQIPTSYILSKLIKGDKLNDSEMDELENIIYNLGFSSELQQKIRDINLENPFYRGIITSLLSYDMNNPLEAFFPLQKFPEEDEKVTKITDDWEKLLLEILSVKGGKNIHLKKKSNKKTRKITKIIN
jgi:hypothetical protein